jgi:RNA polymerase-binding transcription factor DksA
MTYTDKLKQRKKEIELTLQHLAKERYEVQENTEWIDQAAYEKRISLLNLLVKWYREEMTKIDDVLGCVQESRYGLCLACHEPIEADRLEISPEVELCFDCEEIRDRS